jgi:hypothetical protein
LVAANVHDWNISFEFWGMQCKYVVLLKLNHSNFAAFAMYMRFPQNSVEKLIEFRLQN